MNRIEQLINELCPNGVEYKKLANVTIWDKKFNSINKDLQTKVVSFKHVSAQVLKSLYSNGGDIVLLSTGNFYGKTTFDLAEKYVNKGEVISIPSGGTANIKYINGIFVDSGNNLAISADSHKYSLKFIYYYLLNNINIIESYFRGSSIKHPDMYKILNIEIPIPPLPIQEEIVRILDNFTELTAELTAELKMRKQQYEYYRDKLLTFEMSETKLVKLGDIAKFTYGYTDSANDFGDFRYIRITDITEDGYLAKTEKFVNKTDESKKYLLKNGDLLVARTGASYGKTLFFKDTKPSVYASYLIKLSLDNNIILNRYYWHFTKSNTYWIQAEKYVSKAGQQQFNANALTKIIVPIPPLRIQQKIVDVLDNFDTVCIDLGIGLPAEIEQRQKQYEYYRNCYEKNYI